MKALSFRMTGLVRGNSRAIGAVPMAMQTDTRCHMSASVSR